MPGSRRRSLASGAAVLAVAASAPADAAGQPRYERLSDERTTTLWAYVAHSTAVRSRPSARSRSVGRLGTTTYLGSPDTVVELGRSGSWLRVRYPGLGPRTGWVRDGALTEATITHSRVVVDRSTLRLTLYNRGHRVRSFAIGAGAPGSPTPAGRTYVRERVVPTEPGGIYGPVAFGLGAYSAYRTDWPGGGQVGIHGTDEPELIPGHVSNGCVRLTNAAVTRLAARLRVGTPVLIR